MFFICFKDTDTGMSSQWENQLWDVIRVFSGLFPIILGEKVPPPMKNGDFSDKSVPFSVWRLLFLQKEICNSK